MEDEDGMENENPSPLIFNKHVNQCDYVGSTTNDVKSQDKQCDVSVIYVNSDGYIENAGFIKKSIIRLEVGNMPKLNAIVLHRTDSSTTEGTLNSFGKGVGTHFLISKNGDIYQVASLFKFTSHVGKIRSRCEEENTWSEEEKKIIKSFGWNPKKKHDHEIIKEYPSRYPYNRDSVGIEVVALYHKGNQKWESATMEQKESVKRLVDLIINIYELGNDDIYEHDKIAYKTAGEGADLYII